MGVFAWLRRHMAIVPDASDSSPQADSAFDEAGPQTRFGMRPGAVVDGLDFYQAIDFQRRWKLRLAAYVRGEARARQPWRDIARDDRCELGRWLREAAARPAQHPQLLQHLREQHALLHRAAADIVRLADDGQREAALQQLRHGEFSQASHATVAHLSELFLALNAGAAGGDPRH